jgi:hypothetical protein
MAHVREVITREGAKRRPVDANGRPLPELPTDTDETDESAAPTRRLPAPNAAMGSSANGAPEITPDEIAMFAGQRAGHPAVRHFRSLMAADGLRREQRQRAAHAHALAEQAGRQRYGQRR